jgi:hypothetical protein
MVPYKLLSILQKVVENKAATVAKSKENMAEGEKRLGKANEAAAKRRQSGYPC